MLELYGISGKLKTLLTRLSSTWAAKLDTLAADYTTTKAGYLDAAITSRAPSSTALDNTVWTSTKAGYIDAAITGRLGSIKNIYPGNITVSSAAGSNTATITAVVTSKTIILNLGSASGADAAVDVRVELTNSTTVTAYKASSTSVGITVGYLVVEFN